MHFFSYLVYAMHALVSLWVRLLRRAVKMLGQAEKKIQIKLNQQFYQFNHQFIYEILLRFR